MILSLFWHSLCLATLSALGAVVFGVLLARFWLEWKRGDSWVSRVLESVSILPFILSSTLISTAVLIRWRSLDWSLGWGAVIACHCLMNSMWVSSQVSDDWIRLPPDSTLIARSLGNSRFHAFLNCFLMPLQARLRRVFLQVFLFSFTSFAPVMILGGGPPVATLETEIYAAIRYSGLEWGSVGGLILLQTAALLVISGWLEPRIVGGLGSPSVPGRAGPLELFRRTAWVLALLLTFWILLPMIGVPHDLAMGLVPAWQTLQLSIMSAFLILCFSLGFEIAFRRQIQIRIFRIILGALSPMAGAAMLFYFVSRNLDLVSGSWVWILASQCLFFSPFALRSLSGAMNEQMDREIQWARSCGAGACLRFSRIWIPALGPSVFRLFGILMVFSMGDLVSVSLFGGEDARFLVLEIARATARMDLGLSMELGKWWMALAVGVLVLTGQRLKKI